MVGLKPSSAQGMDVIISRRYNASSHVKDLSNVRVRYLPQNTTSELQPFDAGIINSFKANYWRLFCAGCSYKFKATLESNTTTFCQALRTSFKHRKKSLQQQLAIVGCTLAWSRHQKQPYWSRKVSLDAAASLMSLVNLSKNLRRTIRWVLCINRRRDWYRFELYWARRRWTRRRQRRRNRIYSSWSTGSSIETIRVCCTP